MERKRRKQQNKGKQKRQHPLFLVLVFLLGAALVLFPVVSQISYYLASHENINQFEKEAAQIDNKEIDRRIELAHAYNETVTNKNLVDPYTKLQKEGRTEYARMLKVHEQIGYVSVPRIGEKLPIYAGTSETVLQKGVGHLEGTSLPVGGPSTHAVLTAHRGLPTARLFTDLDKVKKGDIFFVKNIKETLAYKVDQIRVVEPTELDAVAIVEGKDYMTLLTCTPYMINSHRLLVRGHRIPYSEKEEKQEEAKAGIPFWMWILLGLLLLVIFLTIYLFWKRRKQKQV